MSADPVPAESYATPSEHRRSPPRSPRPSLATRPVVGVSTLALFASLYFSLVSCRPFWRAVLSDRSWSDPTTGLFAAAVLVALVSLNLFVLGLVLTRRTARPVLAFLVIASAVATFYIGHFGVVLDPGMIRNALHTETKEAADLVGWPLLGHLLVEAGPALLFLGWIRVDDRRPIARRLLTRSGVLAASAVLFVGSLGATFQDLSSLFREHKEVRYLITPLNVVYSGARALGGERAIAPAQREIVGADVKLGPDWTPRRRPVLLFVVVGETARAANWGLNGYPRDTTPELSKLDVINYPRVTSCGSDTETSLPCLFSPFGRRHYDEARIRGSQSLLQVLARAGFDVSWRDNQTGCKGVCDGLDYRQVDEKQADCEPGQCPDQKLLDGLEAELAAAAPKPGDGAMRSPGRVVVLHQLGNHGPAYYKRYPDAFRHFTPACETSDLRRCSVDEIVNAYDNALRYTDHIVADSVRMLDRLSDRYDTALLYVSDHGESLGEKGLFLHGIPYAFAPVEQTRVPMVMWLSKPFEASADISASCLKAAADQPVSHDFVFSTVLGLLDLQTTVRDSAFDLTAACHPRGAGPLDAEGAPKSLPPIADRTSALSGRLASAR